METENNSSNKLEALIPQKSWGDVSRDLAKAMVQDHRQQHMYFTPPVLVNIWKCVCVCVCVCVCLSLSLSLCVCVCVCVCRDETSN